MYKFSQAREKKSSVFASFPWGESALVILQWRIFLAGWRKPFLQSVISWHWLLYLGPHRGKAEAVSDSQGIEDKELWAPYLFIEKR